MARLSRTAQILVAVVLMALAVCLFLWTARSDRIVESRTLSGDLALAARKLTLPQLDELGRQKGDLEKRITVATQKINTDIGPFFASARSIDVTDTLLDTAASLGVDIADVKTSGVQKETMGGVTVITLPLTVKVEGDPEWLTEFIIALSEKFPAESVKSAEITIPRPTAAKGQTEPARPSALIQLVIYSYSAEANG